MPKFGEIATIILGRGGKISGAPTKIVEGLLKGRKLVTAPGNSI